MRLYDACGIGTDAPDIYAEIVREDEWNAESEDIYEDALAEAIKRQMIAYGYAEQDVDTLLAHRGHALDIKDAKLNED